MDFLSIDQSANGSSSSIFDDQHPLCLQADDRKTTSRSGAHPLFVQASAMKMSLLPPFSSVSEEFPRPSSFDEPLTDPRLEPNPISSNSSPSLAHLLDFAVDASVQQYTSSLSVQVPMNVSKRTIGAIHEGQSSQPTTKRQRRLPNTDEMAPPSQRHHEDRWYQQFQKLQRYKEEHGHCCVPITTLVEQSLARWVKRQRYHYKRFKEGKSSSINTARINMLESLGFVWDTHSDAWQEKWTELAAFKEENGHCSLSSYDPEHPQLATWVKGQRRQYKLLRIGETSSLTPHRIAALESLGFAWSVRNKYHF